MKKCECIHTIKTAAGEVWCPNHGTIEDPLDKYNVMVDRHISRETVRYLYEEKQIGPRVIAKILRVTRHEIMGHLRALYD